MNSVVKFQPAISAIRFCKSLDDKPRPLKVIFADEIDASIVLKNSPKFAKKYVTVRNDLRVEQRRYLVTVHDELSCRIFDTKSNSTINYVDKVPSIVQKQKNA